MPIHTRKNPYLGVNAHANSWLLDTEGEWPSFHSDFIIRMTDKLNDVLPPGYEARPERSLIIRETLPGVENKLNRERTRRPQPDTTIYQFGERQANAPTPGAAHAPSLLLTAREAMSDREGDPNAVIIYNVKLGKPVTRIELLSPSNKPPANENEAYRMAGYDAYNRQRELALRSGTCLIEIDLIHTQPSVIPRLGNYPDTPGSHPYSVVVIDPHPSLDEGTAKIYQFDIDQPFPQFNVPLGNDQYVPASAFDLGVVYNTTYARTPTLARILDYEQLPVRFDSYALADQTRITHRMIMLRINQQLDSDLNQDVPFSIDLNLIERFLNSPDRFVL